MSDQHPRLFDSGGTWHDAWKKQRSEEVENEAKTYFGLASLG